MLGNSTDKEKAFAPILQAYPQRGHKPLFLEAHPDRQRRQVFWLVPTPYRLPAHAVAPWQRLEKELTAAGLHRNRTCFPIDSSRNLRMAKVGIYEEKPNKNGTFYIPKIKNEETNMIFKSYKTSSTSHTTAKTEKQIEKHLQ